MTGPHVRDAVPGDADVIARVQGSTWEVAYMHLFGEELLRDRAERLERRAAWWKELLETGADDRAHTLVAAIDAGVVGFVDVRPSRDRDADDGRVGELTAIYVVPEAWGTGAGRALMTEAVERLRTAGFEEATLWMLDDNPRARRFYEIAGWSTDGAVKDDVIMDTPVREVRYRISLGR
jgi:GNAT superfamily N-acetyltransferase